MDVLVKLHNGKNYMYHDVLEVVFAEKTEIATFAINDKFEKIPAIRGQGRIDKETIKNGNW